jgi:hypothetical protein
MALMFASVHYQLHGAERIGSCIREGAQLAPLRLLPENWQGHSPAELSILVHEMVHHLQNVGRLKFECPQEREQLAYDAQEKWLSLFGRDLEHDFGMDAMSIFVKSKCFY